MRQPAKNVHHTLVSARPDCPVTGDRRRLEDRGIGSWLIEMALDSTASRPRRNPDLGERFRRCFGQLSTTLGLLEARHRAPRAPVAIDDRYEQTVCPSPSIRRSTVVHPSHFGIRSTCRSLRERLRGASP
jgi:hypothetical protein